MNRSGYDRSPDQKTAVALALLAGACAVVAMALSLLRTTAGYSAMAVGLVAACVLLFAAGTRMHPKQARKDG